MPASLYVAPAGHGKTRFVLERVRAVLAEGPLVPVMVLLPNREQVAAFRRRLVGTGGALGVEILTFSALYAELLACAGQPIPRLPDFVQLRVLRAILDDLCEAGVMRHYASLRRRPGFVAELRNTIEELKQARIDSEQFAAAVQGFGPRLEEPAGVYVAYQEWLRRENWADPEGQGWLAAIALEQNPALESDLRLLVVDGFDEFNPTQLGVLARLAERAGETLITLSGDLDHERPAQLRFRRARQALTSALAVRPEPLPGAAAHFAGAIAWIETNLFEPVKTACEDSLPGVEFLEAQNRAAEARAALRWIKARLVRDGLALDEVAVLSRSLDPYRPFLEESAAEFGLPLRLAGGMPLSENPAVAALLALLALPLGGWRRRPLVEAWRSPYFDWPALGITPRDAAALDAISRQGRVVAGLAQWQEAFDLWEQMPPARLLLDEDDPASPSGAVPPVSELRRKFNQFTALLVPPEQAGVREYVAFIEDLIGDDPALAPPAPKAKPPADEGLNVVACARAHSVTAGRDVAALRAFKDVLRGLALAEAAMDSRPGSGAAGGYSAFYADLRGAVEAATSSAAEEDGVLVASVLHGRGLNFRAVALLGLAEGEFPRLEREDILLREVDRRVLRERGLPLQSRLRGDEAAFCYQAVTRACEKLLLTRPYLAEDGQEWEVSSYWSEIRGRLGNPAARRIRPEDPPPIAEAASLPEFVAATGQFDEHLLRGAAALRSRLDRSAAGLYEGELLDLAPRLAGRYSSGHAWSASRLEAYGSCPFYFYIAHALELEPQTPPEEGYDVRILGSMLHKILEETYRQASNPADLDECLRRLPGVARQVFSSAPALYGFRPTPLWELQQRELERALEKTFRSLAEFSQGYTPRHFEASFGMGQPSLVLHTDLGEIRLHGYIDRVDEGPDGRLRVVDYKAGGASITYKHLLDGRRLQLPVYALAVQEALGLGRVSGGFYWFIQRAEASSLQLEDCEGGVEGAFETSIAHITRFVENVRAGRFQPQPPADGCPRYCPAAGFCWRYKKGF